MAIDQDLMDEIVAAIRSTINASLTTSNKPDLLFQAYIFSLVIEAAKAEGGGILYENVYGRSLANFVFRAKPGYIYSRRRAYTHTIVEFPSKPLLEIHMGVRVLGKSRVLHECDIAVIRRDEAEACRQDRYHPSSSRVILAVECKFYSSDLDLDLARSFIGLDSDLSVQEDSYFVSNSSSDSVNKLLNGRGKSWERNIIPSNVNDVTRLRNLFQKTFENFKASN